MSGLDATYDKEIAFRPQINKSPTPNKFLIKNPLGSIKEETKGEDNKNNPFASKKNKEKVEEYKTSPTFTQNESEFDPTCYMKT